MNFFRNCLLFGTAVFTLASCVKDERNYALYYEIAYGNVVWDDDRYNIRRDDGVLLYVAENFAQAEVTDHERVLAGYTILNETSEAYIVRLNFLEPVLSKKPLYSSALTAEELDGLGMDPVNIQSIYVTGRYANLHFEILYNDPAISHFINLLVDEGRSTDRDVYLSFRHNAYGDAANFPVNSRASFDLTDLLPEGVDEITVYLSWTNYGQVDRMVNFIFKRPEDDLTEKPSGTA